MIYTPNGNKPISEVKKGDMVKTLNIYTKEIELKSVNDVFKFENTKKIILKNGKNM